ncbi:MAG: restriction endonuclease subunit S [Prevotella sp.]|nr:restriction endonuclease subunit S [Prevotella sp.]
MSEWKEVRLGDVGKIVGGATPSTRNPQNYGGVIPWITPKDLSINKERFIEFGERNISELGLNSCSAKMLPKGSILFSSRAPIGYVAIAHTSLCTNQGFKSFVPDTDKMDSMFSYYLLKHNSENIANLGSGTTFMEVSGKVMSDFIVNIPDLLTQQEIAGILSSLDAKIETNNKLNEKLEEMAQAIFKSWFVDFEPFKDKPFHETEIGYIPQIFESGVLGDLCTFKRGKGLLSKDAIFGNVPVIAGGMKPACYHNIANTKAPVVTVSGSGANAGYTQIHNVDVWASDCSFIDSNCENLYYVYCFLSRRPKLLRHSQTGAAQPHVKPADIHRFQVVIPTKDVINEFQQIVKPLFDRIGMNKKENDRLASLRDTLLPRLMSGELIV